MGVLNVLSDQSSLFFVATTALANGVSLVDASWKTYDDTDMAQMELHEVLNYNNSLYELNTSINMPKLNVLDLDMTKEENIELREQYINTVKENIMKIIEKFNKKNVNLKGESPVCIAFLGDSVTQGCFGDFQISETLVDTVFDAENGYHTKLRKILNML